MSDEDNEKKDNVPDDRDPYNFFKFAGPEEDDKKKKDQNNDNKPHFPFWGIMLLILAVIAVVNIFVMSKPDELVDFSEFRQLIEDGKIVSVEIGDTYFIGYG